MNKKWLLVLMVAVCALAFAGSASAVTYVPKNCLYIEAPNTTGLVTMRGNPEDISEYLKEFCPDIVKYSKKGCGYDYTVNPSSVGVYQLDMRAVSDGQRSFNGKKDELWLHIPHPLVVVGPGLLIERSAPSAESEDGKGGAHFTFVGDLEGQDYKVLHPVSQGGEACVETAQMQAIPPVANVEPPPAVPTTPPTPSVLPTIKCNILVTGDGERTEVLKNILGAYWNVIVYTQPGKGKEVIVTGPGGTKLVMISNKLLGQLKKLVGHPNAGDSLNSLCPEQARLIREAIGNNCK